MHSQLSGKSTVYLFALPQEMLKPHLLTIRKTNTRTYYSHINSHINYNFTVYFGL